MSEGSGRDTTVFINGQQVGPTHQGSFYRFTYEITPFVNVGASNTLGVTLLPNDPVLTGEWGDWLELLGYLPARIPAGIPSSLSSAWR